MINLNAVASTAMLDPDVVRSPSSSNYVSIVDGDGLSGLRLLSGVAEERQQELNSRSVSLCSGQSFLPANQVVTDNVAIDHSYSKPFPVVEGEQSETTLLTNKTVKKQ